MSLASPLSTLFYTRVAILAGCLCPLLWAEDLSGQSLSAGDMKGVIAYVRQTEGFWQVWTIDLPSGRNTQITTSGSDKRTPCWNGRGNEITYRTNNGVLEVIDIQSRKVNRLEPSLGQLVDPRPSPSGKHLAFARFEPDPADNTNLFVYTFESKKLLRITDSTSLEYAPAWSPDETQIAYVGGRGRDGNLLRIMRADGTQKKLLQHKYARDISPTWSPNGTSIVFSSNLNGDYEIWRINPDGTGLTQLTRSPGLDTHPCFAPDSSAIVFTSNREGNLGLWLMLPDGGRCGLLTSEASSACEPAWWQARSTSSGGEPQ